MSLGLKKNDSVIVLKGRAKGKKGKILRFDAGRNRAFVSGVNLMKRFARKTRKNPQGGVVESENSIPLANLALFCGACGKAVRFRTNVLKDGSKTRLCSGCEAVLGET